jgi:SHS2 domain-containing protein
MTPQRLDDEPAPRTTRWEHYEHGADIGVRGFGATKAEAFEQAGLALTAVVADLRLIGQFEPVRIDCEAPDDELLLAEWLNALVYQMATRRLLFSRFVVKIDGNRLRAQAWGEAIDPERHPQAAGLKRASRTTLCVARHGEGWLAQTVLER